ncbi:NADP oxidoreductase [Mycobacterium sp. CBMA271]|uniref:FAD-dependent oxidoreductase n=1 Tax=unclassified Mycobacteroides TaxID=2618759 RepID=UPI00132BDBF5|nr:MULTISPECIES: FAD-dependent oxidoreductase [unclassified Mycobacteroides]MUM17909.1 NADP oxidoreductase [Mycobacteroides sp. CBMA 326]MUM20478.1 NADP oxidoreductase [Mycobacteroides sp. CBMA 271]
MRAVHVAIVGAGPSGFFAAGSLLKHADFDVHVDMLEMLPTPWGLVRSGVAPDHPKIKSVSAVFEKTATHPRFRFFGNIEVGVQITAEELAARYDAVIYAVGAQSDKPLGIPGDQLPGCVAAVDVVGWYNANPTYQSVTVDLSGERAVVVGNGNVALDVARILGMDPESLHTTDIADRALDSLDHNAIREVVIIGRRGPLQATFTPLELREMGELPGVDVIVDPSDLEGITDEQLAAAPKATRTNIDTLRKYAQREPTAGNRRVVFRFRTSPIELHGDGEVESITVGRNELVDEDGYTVARDTGERETLPTHLVVRAIGYRGVPVPGLPFDSRRGVIVNGAGRIEDRNNEYVVGWIKRGPVGVIGTNKSDSQETVDTLLADLATAELGAAPDVAALEVWLLGHEPHIVSQSDWLTIDSHERANGEPQGRPRVKLETVPELLAATGRHGEA